MPAGDRTTNRRRLAGLLLTSAGVVIPALSLIPLGSLWLWQNGYLLYWALGSFTAVMSVVALEWLLLRRAGALPAATTAHMTDMAWSEREHGAWAAIEKFAGALTPEQISGEQAITRLGAETIDIVARHLHPGDEHPLWNFTVPEALTLAERVASRLRPILVENVPLGDQLTVRQLMKMYEWRIAANWAERAYDIWRIVRLINPATALANEARERVTRRLYTSLRDEFTQRLARAYVFEVARAAIDLYSGRLKVDIDVQPPPANDVVVRDATMNPDTRSGKFRWSRVARQTANAGKTAVRSFWPKRQPPAA
ncbi:MAG: GTP-binding protein HSR1 [Hyphomicrobium sp.]|nr:GTP-binding protein HSR1 [Hyphomicrobium sp.]